MRGECGRGAAQGLDKLVNRVAVVAERPPDHFPDRLVITGKFCAKAHARGR